MGACRVELLGKELFTQLSVVAGVGLGFNGCRDGGLLLGQGRVVLPLSLMCCPPCANKRCAQKRTEQPGC
jgi:hypothetical protein